MALKAPAWLALLAGGLCVLGLVYTSVGTYSLVASVPGSFPVDLRLRWVESRLLGEGLNPQIEGHPDPLLPPANEFMRHASGGYPPWSYSMGLLFAPPLDWNLARYWFATLSLLALAAVASFAWQRARPFGLLPAVIAACLPFTNFSTAICLSYGQYGAVVSGLVAGAAALLDRRRESMAGVLLALALVKPTLSASYCVALVAARRWIAVAVTAFCTGVATVVMAAIVSEPPHSVMARAIDEMDSTRISSNPALSLTSAWMSERSRVLALGFAGVGISLLVAIRHPHDAFRLASIAVIVAMFWSYRKHFDVSMMSLPLVWLWITAQGTKSAVAYVAFFAAGLTLWLPIRDAQWDLWGVQALQLLVWPATGWWIYSASPHVSSPLRTPEC